MLIFHDMCELYFINVKLQSFNTARVHGLFQVTLFYWEVKEPSIKDTI